jgi:hypothetical protein
MHCEYINYIKYLILIEIVLVTTFCVLDGKLSGSIKSAWISSGKSLYDAVSWNRISCHHSVWLQTGRPGDWNWILDRGKRIFTLTSVSRPALGPTQPPVQWVPAVLSPGVKRDRGVTLTAHPHLVPRSIMSRSYKSSPSKRLHGVLWDCFTCMQLAGLLGACLLASVI